MIICTKKKYASRDYAKSELKKINKLCKNKAGWVELTNVYKCAECDYWHTTSMNKKQSRNLSFKLSKREKK